MIPTLRRKTTFFQDSAAPKGKNKYIEIWEREIKLVVLEKKFSNV